MPRASLWDKGAILTIVERKTAFLMMRKLDNGKQAGGLAKQLIDMLIPYKNAVLSITSDNGGEFAPKESFPKGPRDSFGGSLRGGQNIKPSAKNSKRTSSTAHGGTGLPILTPVGKEDYPKDSFGK